MEDERDDLDEILNPIWLDGITVTPRGNRTTTYDDWYKTNELERASQKHAARVSGHYPSFRTFTKKAATLGLNVLGKMGKLFNTLATSGAETDFGLTSPFSDIDRKAVQRSRRRIGKKTRDKIEEYSAFLSPSSYIAAASVGRLDPRTGAQVLAELSPELQLASALFDIWAVGRNSKIPGDIKKGAELARNAGRRILGYALEDFHFPENGRIRYTGPEIAKLQEVIDLLGRDDIKKLKYKYGIDQWDKLMLDDMLAKLKKHYDSGDIEQSLYDYSRGEIEKLKNKTYNVIDYDDISELDGDAGLAGDFVSYLSDRTTGTHESIMHGSDYYVDIYDPFYDFWGPYEVFVDKLGLPEGSAAKWYEARATVGEMKRLLLLRAGKAHPEAMWDIEKIRPYYEELVNMLSDKQLARMLKKRGWYGKTYIENMKKNPTFLLELRNLLLNGF